MTIFELHQRIFILEILKIKGVRGGILLNKSIYLAVSMFVLGFVAAAIVYNVDVRYAFSSDSSTVDSPSDHIAAEDLHVFTDKAVIEKDSLKWARILNTHSMEPALNANSISLEVLPKTSSEINVGDIISYSHDSRVIIHRVISVAEDSSGWYAITKGDNNKEADPWKVRFEDVKGVVVGVLY